MPTLANMSRDVERIPIYPRGVCPAIEAAHIDKAEGQFQPCYLVSARLEIFVVKA
jgi:hypothetical protein